jgi:hypothetical protein
MYNADRGCLVLPMTDRALAEWSVQSVRERERPRATSTAWSTNHLSLTLDRPWRAAELERCGSPWSSSAACPVRHPLPLARSRQPDAIGPSAHLCEKFVIMSYTDMILS